MDPSAPETIAAIATPPGAGGIGIVRVSGALAGLIARGILDRVPRPRYASHAAFRGADGDPIDKGIALFFRAPGSYTGEDVLELQGHGGPVVLDLVLDRCLQLGARLARPGEMTERAFLNGKLDLAQAEAVADLIASGSALAARMAMHSLQGVFSRRIAELVEAVTELRAYLEATLDFPEDDLDPGAHSAQHGKLCELIAHTRDILEEAKRGERIREGMRVVLAGPPNAGKSSIFNSLIRNDAAIVTPIPGTTRDPLVRDVQFDGLPIRLVDTAGIRESDDLVEREGVARARSYLKQADYILWIYDSTVGLDPSALEGLPVEIPVIVVRNKIDLTGSPALPERLGVEEIPVSVVTGEGLDVLRRRIRGEGLASSQCEGAGAFTARRRHVDALQRAFLSLNAAAGVLAAAGPVELVALDLQHAQRALGEITGEVASDDLLGKIFSTFCIGK